MDSNNLNFNNWGAQPSMDGSVFGYQSQSPEDNSVSLFKTGLETTSGTALELTATTSPSGFFNQGNTNQKGESSTNGQVPPRTRPCDYCRRRKARCITLKDAKACLNCQVKEMECTFVEAPISRKKKAPPVVSVEGSSDPFLASSAGSKKAKLDKNLGIREVTPVQDYSSMRGRSLLKRTLSLQFPRSSFYVGETSVLDTTLFEVGPMDKMNQAQLAGDVWLRRVAPGTMFTLKNDYTEDVYQETINYADEVERVVAPNGHLLINLYFRVVHPSFPVLHKKVFLEKYSRTHREFSPPLLASVYMLALNWWHYDASLSPYPKPDSQKLLNLAVETFSKVLEKPKLSAVQAGLLLLQCRPNHARNWAICSQVMAIAEELGLGLDCSHWQLPKWERGLRTRLAWALFIQDKWLSLIESRPSHIDLEKNWMVRHLTKEDFPETGADDMMQEGSSDVEIGRLLFLEMINLSTIVNKILDRLFTISAIAKVTNTEEILEVAKPIQIELKQWYQTLRNNLAAEKSNSSLRRLSSTGYLHLAYFAAEITLHRRIIKSLNYDSHPQLIKVCREAAKERLTAAMIFIKDLTREQMQSFWHSSACANFALVGSFAALLHVTSNDEQEAEYYKGQLSDYLWTLRISSGGFSQMEAALQELGVAISRVAGFRNSDCDLLEQQEVIKEEQDDD